MRPTPGEGQIQWSDEEIYSKPAEVLEKTEITDEDNAERILEIGAGFESREIKLGKKYDSLPGQIFRISNDEAKHIPTKKRNGELKDQIIHLYPGGEDRGLIIEYFKAELADAYEDMESSRINRILQNSSSDEEAQQRYPEYRILCEKRDKAISVIKYLKDLEDELEMDGKLSEKLNHDLLNSYEEHLYHFMIEGQILNITLKYAVPRYLKIIEANNTKRADVQNKIKSDIKYEIVRHFDIGELDTIISLLKKDGRQAEAEMLQSLI